MYPLLSQLSGLVPAQSADPAASSLTQVHSVLDFIVKGGPTMIMICICSLVALAVIVERLIVLRRRNVVPAGFIEGIRQAGQDRDRLLDLCKSNASPVANVFAAAIRRRGERIEVIEKAVGDAGRREVLGLRHRMRLLSALPQVSTMLGLLGTIFGMIKTFQSVAASGQSLGKTETLAKGIYEAWTNTAAGLLVAIPVLIAYHMLLGRIDGLMVELDRAAVDFVEMQSGTTPATMTTGRTEVIASNSINPVDQVSLTAQPAVA